jgi:hypothetical protein
MQISILLKVVAANVLQNWLRSRSVNEKRQPNFGLFFVPLAIPGLTKLSTVFCSQLEFLKDGYETSSFICIRSSFYDCPVDEIHFACVPNRDLRGLSLSLFPI